MMTLRDLRSAFSQGTPRGAGVGTTFPSLRELRGAFSQGTPRGHGLGYLTLAEHGAVCPGGAVPTRDSSSDEVCPGNALGLVVVQPDGQPNTVFIGGGGHRGGGHPGGGHGGGHGHHGLGWLSPLQLRSAGIGDDGFGSALNDDGSATAQAGSDAFKAEADRDVAVARSTGNAPAAQKLLDDAWLQYVPLFPAAGSPAVQAIYQDAASYYMNAGGLIASYQGAGSNVLAADSANANQAVVDQNAAYEASGQAARDRALSASEIQRAQTSPVSYGLHWLGDTGGDTGVARQAGGADTGVLGNAADYYRGKAPTLPKITLPNLGRVAAGAALGAAVLGGGGALLAGTRGVMGGVLSGTILGALLGYATAPPPSVAVSA